ncbi:MULTISPECIES: methyl-accepting chemotaxis protein [unclassified Paenibacillus]|uniref:methyl-accepting chemotaxis protein n=1 Tax=unclassified Paenibacillus TaxID=185978 RepID=UPI0009567497|nr:MULTISPECIES: methyl-accepting chemotaxis protein [unclassified Paenibacillus]SIQ75078.1 methyl-accepting chemotaxis protein [Paenibacillus sp. RU4X]SIQ96533.1 methyl-accepting chemotaxis protein [Paenibacillus sp. RU4T]
MKINFNIRMKLISSFVLVSLLFGLSSVFTIHNVEDTKKSYDYIVNTAGELRSLAQSIQTDSAVQISAFRAYMLYGDAKYKTQIYDANSRIDAAVKNGLELAVLEESKKRLKEIGEANQQFKQVTVKVMNSYLSNKKKAAEEGVTIILPVSESITSQADSMAEWMGGTVIPDNVKKAGDQAHAGLIAVIVISTAAALVALALGSLVSWFLTRPLIRLSASVKRVAEGDLTGDKLVIRGRDEIHRLNEAFHEMTVGLKEMIGGIAGSAGQLAASAEQLKVGAQQSGKAAETVASAIQEIAGGAEMTTVRLDQNQNALQEVLGGAKLISAGSESVLQFSRQTFGEAEDGSRYVEDNLNQMRFIHESVQRSNEVIGSLSGRSRQIGGILKVIADLARQTNLLALNAAIEAARAGEHGKGFGVVAGEVRALAEQSQQSAKNIAALIAGIQQDTEASVAIMSEVVAGAQQGLSISELTSEKFSRILSGTENMIPHIEEMAAVVKQITGSIQEVADSASQIAGIAQSHAAGSEEAAASTEEQLASMEEIHASASSLSAMAEEMKRMVDRFKIE